MGAQIVNYSFEIFIFYCIFYCVIVDVRSDQLRTQLLPRYPAVSDFDIAGCVAGGRPGELYPRIQNYSHPAAIDLKKRGAVPENSELPRVCSLQSEVVSR